MITTDGYRRHVLEQRAIDLLALLDGTSGFTAHEAVDKLGWTRAMFDGALDHARTTICPELGVTIPHPVPADGWKYHVTGDWLSDDGSPAIEAGTAWALGIIESRLRTLLRDVRVAKTHANPRSVVGRKINLIDKRLGHIVATLDTIGSSVVKP